MAIKFAYYPGSVVQSSAPEVDEAMRAIAPLLDIDLIHIPSLSSCGEGVIRQANNELQLALNARNFAIAEDSGLEILTPSASSYGNMWKDLSELNSDDELKQRINKVLARTSDMRFEGTTNIRHLLHVLVDEIGLDKIKSLVVNPIDLPVAAYYGPNLLLPGSCGDDDPWNPTYFESLVKALGGEPIYIDGRTQSVGHTSILSQEKTVLKMTAEILNEAISAGAKVLASACPFSSIALDNYQVKAGRATNSDTSIPVIHLPELIAFALGFFPERFAFLRTRVMVIGT